MFAGTLVIAKLAFILIIMFKWGKPSSSKFFLFDGINPRRVKLYFIDMIAYRVGLAAIVLITNFVNLKIRVLLLVIL